jgi:hypothetical protein
MLGTATDEGKRFHKIADLRAQIDFCEKNEL